MRKGGVVALEMLRNPDSRHVGGPTELDWDSIDFAESESANCNPVGIRHPEVDLGMAMFRLRFPYLLESSEFA